MNDKPILIDALHICMGGGLMILNHLVNNLVNRRGNFVLLKDKRCPKLQSEDSVKYLKVFPASFKVRHGYYRKHRNDFRSVLCFGNIPPTIKLNVPVYTYLHNVSLLKIPQDYEIKDKILTYLKKTVLRFYSKNTTNWIVQTANTENLVNIVLKRKNQSVFQFPFYCIPPYLKESTTRERTDYIFVGDYTNAKGHEYLVDAWVKLHHLGVNPVLHLTVSNPMFSKYINDARAEGADIVNHGIIPFNEVVELYKRAKATVYPSLNESLGLGIIEAVESGCDVIGADLPYLHSVCNASAVFKPCNSDSIVCSVLKYEAGECPSTTLLIHDSIDEFITFLEQ